MIEPVRKSLSLADGAISYLEWGGDGPLLHFAHANGFNAQTYTSLLQPLSGRFHIVASDERGHGFSLLPTPEGFAAGWTQFRDDLIALLDALDAGPAILAGHSMGGTMSLMAAALRPERVQGLVLVEPVFVPAMAPMMMRLSRIMKRDAEPHLADRAAKRRDVFASADEVERSYRGRGAFKFWPDLMLHDYVAGGTVPTEDGRVRLACSPRVEAACFRAAPVAKYRLAAQVQCPVTLIHGEGAGSTCSPASARAFAQRKPGTRVVALKGVGHFLPMQKPEIVREEINALADRILLSSP